MNSLLIENGTVVNEGRSFTGYIIVRNGVITEVGEGGCPVPFDGRRIDASGKLVIPGVIDDQVHFRQPGLTHKGDIRSESRAAVAGGVTSYMEMPNTMPPTITAGALEDKFRIASEVSAANYSFYLGATNENKDVLRQFADSDRICGIKVFMGSSTGNMLVDNEYALSRIFAETSIPVAVHCEEESIIRENIKKYTDRYGTNISSSMHPLIRSEEACYRSTAKAVELADKYGTELHVLHLSTGRELGLFETKSLKDKKITCEVCVHHLWFDDTDYDRCGTLIKWNPAIKTPADREALLDGFITGRVDIIATDHAPHTLEEKTRGYWNSPSGGPLVQHSLTVIMEMARAGIVTREQVVDKMCHAPATRFRVKNKGYIRRGYDADIVIFDPRAEWTVTKENILYKCGWSPFEGTRFSGRVTHTLIGGHVVYDNGRIDDSFRGKPLEFDR